VGNNQNKKKKLATRFIMISVYFIVFIILVTVVVFATNSFRKTDSATVDHTRTYTMETTDNMDIVLTIFSVSFVLLLYITAASLFIWRSIFKPLNKLTESVTGSVIDENGIYGTDRNDEIGELARTTKDAWHRLNNMAVELKDAAKAADDANLLKSAFLANMSHEIRTPMNVILGVTEILMQDSSLTPTAHDEIITIYNSGDMLLSIINDILDLSKIEAGKLEIINASYDITGLVNDTVVLNMMRSGNKPVEFNISVDEKLPATLTGDELRIKQILGNLLSNAFKYTSKGKVELSFAVEDAKKIEQIILVITVGDTGKGMTEDEINDIFDEYSRFVNRAEYTEGTGLGMSITRNLVRLMNGDISIKSEPDVGSVFTVRLPQYKTGAKAIGSELAASLQDFRHSGAKQLEKKSIDYEYMPYGKILVVDDVESNLFVAQGLMAPYGLTVETVTNGYHAIDKIKEGNVYDIVFMDHIMPKPDGIATTKAIRSLGYTAPIIALSANAVAGQAITFLANGFDEFIPKPIDVWHLNTILEKYVLNKHQSGGLDAAGLQKTDRKIHIPDKTTPASVSPLLAELFVKDAIKAVRQLQAINKKHKRFNAEDIRLFTITVHAMKSAFSNVGEFELSTYAEELERAGWKNDIDTISAELPAIINKLQAIIKKYKPLKVRANDELYSDYNYLQNQIKAFKDACDTYDKKTAKAIIIELRSFSWSTKIKELLSLISEQLLSGDIDLALKTVEKISELIPQQL